MECANMKPRQAIISKPRVPMKIHFLPNMSDKRPTGMTVEATSTPIKKQAPRKPIRFLLSQSICVCPTQLSMYVESDSSG